MHKQDNGSIKSTAGAKYYSPTEEKINIFSHIIGLALSIVALPLLVLHANRFGNIWHLVSFSIFGTSLVTLYAASVCYHSAKEARQRSRLRVIDHASIYVLIAGSYTPFTLVTLHGPVGWAFFAVSWGMALTGIVLKLFFTGRYNLLSTLMYVFMGWVMVFAIRPLIDNLALNGLLWLLAGGLAYTIGAITYSIKRIKFNHAIFHVFVVIGSFSHFISVYCYVLIRA